MVVVGLQDDLISDSLCRIKSAQTGLHPHAEPRPETQLVFFTLSFTLKNLV